MSDLTSLVVGELEMARRRTLGLLEPVPEELLVRQHSELLSPMVWDLAHIANYEDLWLLRGLGEEGVGATYDGLYDAFLHPRRTRGALAMLDLAGARAYGDEVRGRVLDLLARRGAAEGEPAGSGGWTEPAGSGGRIEPAGSGGRIEPPGSGGNGAAALRAGAFVYGMVVQHEHQHDETLLAALALLPEGYDGLRGERRAAPWRADPPAECLVPAGSYVVGTSADPWAYDNERPAHQVELAAYAVDGAPVTNAGWAAFLDAGGYHEARHWTARGWAWRQEAGLERPLGWQADGAGGWVRERFGSIEPVPPDEPVQHVCWYEADAFARWAGRRLLTEVEWEVAATCDPVTGTKRRHPWGDEPWRPGLANLGQERLGPDPVGAHPDGRSPVGCFAMEGDVWEWTSSSFDPWPGTATFPYREYSEVFYGGDYKVLRGGSWATAPQACRGTFRNWDHPIRRHIFAGLRTARSA